MPTIGRLIISRPTMTKELFRSSPQSHHAILTKFHNTALSLRVAPSAVSSVWLVVQLVFSLLPVDSTQFAI